MDQFPEKVEDFVLTLYRANFSLITENVISSDIFLSPGISTPWIREKVTAESMYLLHTSALSFRLHTSSGTTPPDEFPSPPPDHGIPCKTLGQIVTCDPEGEAMSTSSQSWQDTNSFPTFAAETSKWYALQTRARHEKLIAHRLRDGGIATFLPLVSEMHRWSDRRKLVELPLFSCYVFVRLSPSHEDRLRVLRLDGVFGFVGVRGEGTPIPDDQIDAIQALLLQGLPWSNHPFLKIGQRVRIRGGAMDGIEGILVARNGDRTLIVSVDVIQRSLAVRIEGYDVEPA
jgi:transcription antitermination factor NusG